MSYSWVVNDLYTTCSLVVNDLSTTCLWLVLDLFTTCSLLVHDLFMTCSWLVYDLFMTCSWLVKPERGSKIFPPPKFKLVQIIKKIVNYKLPAPSTAGISCWGVAKSKLVCSSLKLCWAWHSSAPACYSNTFLINSFQSLDNNDSNNNLFIFEVINNRVNEYKLSKLPWLLFYIYIG